MAMPENDVSERRSRRFFFKSRSKANKGSKSKLPPLQVMQSLGTGTMSTAGKITFVPSSLQLSNFRVDSDVSSVKIRTNTKMFSRSNSSFIRVSDLDMDTEHTSCSTIESEDSHPNFHHPAIDPPPGVDPDDKEKWIALNDGDGAYSPIAPYAVSRLSALGLTTSVDDCMWEPDRSTKKLLGNATSPSWTQTTFKSGRVIIDDHSHDKEVLVWTGTFSHSFYGSDLPAVRVAGVVDTSANNLVELLIDSGRVKEYNKLSLGRDDLVVFQDSMLEKGPFGCSVTKVMKSVSKVLRKNMVFVSILNATELEDGSGYLIVTRAVHHPDNRGDAKGTTNEILIGVNLIRRIDGVDNQCLMINVNHIRSSMVPKMGAKMLGMNAAISFIHDIRSAC